VKKLEQAHVVLAFQGLSYRDPDHYVMHVISHIVGGGMSSRLFQEIREKRGLCYEVYSFFSPFEDSGLFAIYGGTGETLLEAYMPLVIDTLLAAIESPNEKEVARAKAQMKMSILASLESPGRRAEQMARHMLVYGRVLSRDEMVNVGDFFGSGPPAFSVGFELDRWIKPGDVVSCEIEGVGILSNRIVRE
jgi:predicted Zn-dependent peptidase